MRKYIGRLFFVVLSLFEEFTELSVQADATLRVHLQNDNRLINRVAVAIKLYLSANALERCLYKASFELIWRNGATGRCCDIIRREQCNRRIILERNIVINAIIAIALTSTTKVRGIVIEELRRLDV